MADGNSGLLFFIVDDDEKIIDFQRALLEAAGHRVVHATESENALERIPDEHPDCVITDIMMPGTDGLALLRALRKNDNLDDMRIIVVTAKSYEFDRKQSLKLGADGFITKPIDRTTYVAKIQEILDDQVEMSFWGVRGTLPRSGDSSLRYGGNTSCVTLGFPRGQFFIFDAGTGIKLLSDHLMAEGRQRLDAKIFISHPHWDHINALPFFAPLYIQGGEFEVIGAKHAEVSMRQLISAQMDDIYFPITMKEFASRVYFRDLTEESIEVDGIPVKTMLLSHPGYCLGYRVDYRGRSFCYVTDNELFLPDSGFFNAHYVERLTKFIKGADVFITDCTYTDEEYATKVEWGHSCIGQVVDLAHAAEVGTLYLFHHDPDQDDDAIDAKYEMACAGLKALGSSTQCLAPAEAQTFRI
jgi:phosphoribosyl 1,2-cyclic phosphodiesterase/CheY-like chemotaxis protein